MASKLLFSRGDSEFREAFAICGGANTNLTEKCPTHRFSGPKSYEGRNLFDRAPGFFQSATSGFDTHAFDEPRWRLTDLFAKDPREMARTHGDARRECTDRMIRLGMVHDPGLQIAHGITIGHRTRELG
jgi:hypothetical protein